MRAKGTLPIRRWLWIGAAGFLAIFSLGATCGGGAPLPQAGDALFTSPQTNPLALSNDGTRLYVANTTSGTVSVIDVAIPASAVEVAEIPVGLDPVSVAVRPPGGVGSEVVLVANHISDTISVIDPAQLAVVQTIQGLDASGITTTDEPTGIAFSGPDRAFVTLDHPNQVIVLDRQPDGRWTVDATRLDITAQAPRAVAVAGGRLFVAAFESNNQTEFPSCSVDDPQGTVLNPVTLEVTGCGAVLEIVHDLNLQTLSADFGAIIDFATGPNIGGFVARNTNLPDRDLFIYDANTLALEQTVEGVGTLLYGLAAAGNRIFVTNTEARNQLNGLSVLANRMFENRISYLDCNGGGCAGLTHVDLDQNVLGLPIPTPYGVAASVDGNTLVVSVAGSDGIPGLQGDPGTSIPGLVTLDASGNLLGALQLGAIPQGLTLASDGFGAAQTAYVLNTVDSTLSVVDVSTPGAPLALGAPLVIGSDPTPANVRNGRVMFSSARASTSGLFSCESCHPNGNMDQLLWSINVVGLFDPNLEARTTMPIRGLRDTLPLHWDGVLADPFGGPNGEAGTGANLPADCDLAVDGEIGCIRDLVNGSLGSVMCEQNGAGCPTGVATKGGVFLPGALTDAERDDMAAFLASVSYPPSPNRNPTDELSRVDNGALEYNDPAFVPNAIQGMSDFFTDADGLGLGTTVGPSIGFAPVTCADNPAGCHSLPLTHSTNSALVGGFDAPGIRGAWDRWVLFSNGVFNSERGMAMFQACADGFVPQNPAILDGDPCDIAPISLGGITIGNPLSFPSGEAIWDPAVGPTERGSWLAVFEGLFALVYGVPGASIFEYLSEMSVGLAGLAGRQITVDADNASNAFVIDLMDQIEDAAGDGKITAIARGPGLDPFTFQPSSGKWSTNGGIQRTGAALRNMAVSDPITITAHLPENISIGGADRQPLIDIDPDDLANEFFVALQNNTFLPPTLPSVPANVGLVIFRLGQKYVDAAARVWIDGAVCDACAIQLGTTVSGEPIVDVAAGSLSAGMHAVQIQNPNGWVSNEMPLIAQ